MDGPHKFRVLKLKPEKLMTINVKTKKFINN